jgi:hypothetical protein
MIDAVASQVFSYNGLGSGLSQTSWDGTFNDKELNTGLYLYLIEIQTTNGRRKQYSGEINLLK